MSRLEGQVAVVTGAGSGIGRAVAMRFLEEGACVLAFDRDAQALANLAWPEPSRLVSRTGDVRSANDNRALMAQATEAFGRIDVLVANAGLFDFWHRLDTMDADTLERSFDEIFAVNVKGYLLACHAALEALRATGGSVIMTASVAGLRGGGGGVLYTAAKHAIVGVMRQLAIEFAPTVRVNAVAPGATQTPLAGLSEAGQGGRRLFDRPELLSRSAAALPLKFVPQPEDHTGLYVTLASRRDGRALTGSLFTSDAGATVHL